VGRQGPIAAPHPGLEIAQQAVLERWEATTRAKQIFSPGQQGVGTGLVGGGEPRVGEPRRDGVGAARLSALGCVALGLFACEGPPMTPLG
jgi:hypothetical protein